jgi:prolyl oligopeptidase
LIAVSWRKEFCKMKHTAKSNLVYPPARRGDQVDDYFGTKVADPYRWLEDPDSAETVAWVDAEIALTDSFLSGIAIRNTFVSRMKTLWNYERFTAPWKQGERTFFSKNSGLQNHNVYYVIDEPGSEPRVLFDPNTLSEDGTVAISSFSVNEQGTLLAYGLSYSGSDWVEIHVRDIATGKDLTDHLKWIKFSGARWANDGSGFYYSRYDEPTDMKAVPYYNKVYFHRIGEEQSQDTLIYERPDQKTWKFGAVETEDGRYLLIYVYDSSSGNNRIYYRDLQGGDVVKLLDKADAHWGCIGNDGTTFWFTTDLDAPRGRLVAIDISQSNETRLSMMTVIPEPEDERVIFESVSLVGNRFFASYMRDVHTEVKEIALDGSLIREVKLPGIGSVGGFGGKREDMETYYSYTSYTSPGTTYRYDIATGESTVYFKPGIDIDPNNYKTELVFVTSKDGTQVPLFISYRKGLKRNGQNPTYLYGYGGFNVSLGPSFSSTRTMWMDLGGIYAEAILRGGGEYGEAWHQAGCKLKKQNVFDDFIACAEWLIANRYTSTPKLAIAGGSNGGLLVGACMTQRPELFGACLPAVGVMDMLRFDKFTAGEGWRSDYGSAEASAEEFAALYAYSPYHNLKAGTQYPPTYIETADHDDRVVPGHSFKFAAQLQASQAGNAPCLIRIEKKAGHGAGKPLSKQMQEIADEYGFLVKVLNIPARKLRRLRKAVAASAKA